MAREEAFDGLTLRNPLSLHLSHWVALRV
jgi:hypothetical protein